MMAMAPMSITTKTAMRIHSHHFVFFFLVSDFFEGLSPRGFTVPSEDGFAG
jgi:hypothetical protein